MLSPLVLDSQNNTVSVPSSTNIGERELTNVSGQREMIFEQLHALRNLV